MLNAKFEYGTKPFVVVIIFKIGHNLHILQYWIYCLTQRSARLAQKYTLTCLVAFENASKEEIFWPMRIRKFRLNFVEETKPPTPSASWQLFVI